MTEIKVTKGKVHSGTTVGNNTYLYVLKGGSASDFLIGEGGRVYVSKGGYADWVRAGYDGRITLENGAFLSSATVSQGGSMVVDPGAVASDVKLLTGGSMYVGDGGTVSGLNWTPGDGYVTFWNCNLSFASRYAATRVFYGSGGKNVSSWAQNVNAKAVLDNASMFVMHGGSASNVPVAAGGKMYVFSGGKVSNATVEGNLRLFGGVAEKTKVAQHGKFYVFSGGIASTVNANGYLTVFSGGTATGVTVSENGNVSVCKGAIVSSITLSSGATLYVEKGGMVGNITSKSGAIVTVEKGGNIKWKGDLLPMPSRDCDDGWNDWVYNAKTKTCNNFYWNGNSLVTLSSGFKGRIRIDDQKPAEMTQYDNYVGYRDDIDFQKIVLNKGGRVSLKATASGSVKLTLWKLVDTANYDKDPYAPEKNSLKALQTVTLKWDEQLKMYAAETASILLEESCIKYYNEYFISVECLNAAKGAGAYYNVELSSGTDNKGKEKTHFFFDGDDRYNDWLCSRKARANDSWFNSTTVTKNGAVQVDSKKLNKVVKETPYNNFVGFGDEKDYGIIKLNNNGKLTFTVTATDAAKFSLYKVIETTDRKGVVTYTAKSFLSGALKKNADGVYEFSNKKGLQLLAGVNYYVCVESTNAKKSESGSYYNVSVVYEKMDTVKEGKMQDALTADLLNIGNVPSVSDELRMAGLDQAGSLDGMASAGAGIVDGLNFGPACAEKSPAIGAASALDVLPEGEMPWQNIASLA